uniref:RNase_Zc3h12a domain-containing protein n=1 Tax=Angiostrongylus cantonensis TaxID=6313 RepID=A0A0K0CZ84_ANGCA
MLLTGLAGFMTTEENVFFPQRPDEMQRYVVLDGPNIMHQNNSDNQNKVRLYRLLVVMRHFIANDFDVIAVMPRRIVDTCSETDQFGLNKLEKMGLLYLVQCNVHDDLAALEIAYVADGVVVSSDKFIIYVAQKDTVVCWLIPPQQIDPRCFPPSLHESLFSTIENIRHEFVKENRRNWTIDCRDQTLASIDKLLTVIWSKCKLVITLTCNDRTMELMRLKLHDSKMELMFNRGHVCRWSAADITRDTTLNSIIEQYLIAFPEKRRDAAQLIELDERELDHLEKWERKRGTNEEGAEYDMGDEYFESEDSDDFEPEDEQLEEDAEDGSVFVIASSERWSDDGDLIDSYEDDGDEGDSDIQDEYLSRRNLEKARMERLRREKEERQRLKEIEERSRRTDVTSKKGKRRGLRCSTLTAGTISFIYSFPKNLSSDELLWLVAGPFFLCFDVAELL